LPLYRLARFVRNHREDDSPIGNECTKLELKREGKFNKYAFPTNVPMMQVVLISWKGNNYNPPEMNKLLFLTKSAGDSLITLLKDKNEDGSYKYDKMVEPEAGFIFQSNYVDSVESFNKHQITIPTMDHYPVDVNLLKDTWKPWNQLLRYQSEEEQIYWLTRIYSKRKLLLTELFGNKLPASFRTGQTVVDMGEGDTTPPPPASALTQPAAAPAAAQDPPLGASTGQGSPGQYRQPAPAAPAPAPAAPAPAPAAAPVPPPPVVPAAKESSEPLDATKQPKIADLSNW